MADCRQPQALPDVHCFLWDAGRPFAKHFDAGFEAFTGAGVDGLARVTGQRLEILIVCAENGTALKRFIDLAKTEFAEIACWQFESHCHRDTFLGFDFKQHTELDAITREPRAGLQWSRANQVQLDLWRERPVGARWKQTTDAERMAGERALAVALAMAEPIRKAA